jgi:hypothetical protein
MAYQASGVYEPLQDGDRVVDVGGCVNILTPKRPLAQHTEGMGANSCLINIGRGRRRNGLRSGNDASGAADSLWTGRESGGGRRPRASASWWH